MNSKKILDKTFEISISASEIQKRVDYIASQINKDFQEQQDIVFIAILNGSFMFASDLLKQLEIDCKISFLKLTSYQGSSSSGKVKQLVGLNEDLKNKTVIVIEDIVDTGITLDTVKKQLAGFEPAEIKVATLLLKPDACKIYHQLDYVGFEIPNDFVVGYGLDYNGYGRNLKDIYTLIQ